MGSSSGKITRLQELLRGAKPLRYWSRYRVLQMLEAPRGNAGQSGKLPVKVARERHELAQRLYKRADDFFLEQGLGALYPKSTLARYYDSILVKFAKKHGLSKQKQISDGDDDGGC